MSHESVKLRPASELFNTQPLEWLKHYRGKDFEPLVWLTHNPGYVELLGNGVSIVLSEDGTWMLEDTTGG